MPIPTDQEIRALHAELAPTRAAFDLVHTHCRIVCQIAERLVERGGLDVDLELVRAGSLLHDIGVYRLMDASGALDGAHYVRHGVLGHEALRARGFGEALCRFCSCHTGVGITRADVRSQGLPIPEDDYTAGSAEEEVVMYADKFHSKSSPPVFVSAASYARRVRRFGADKQARFEAMVARYGKPDLEALSLSYGHALV
ncbi:HD domain-containing protein [Nocardiopsis sp. LOL_012]|uniref:HD domain-containing protein n=1 Tax=Nocardiopsis sp. LOL_012 TaxID=3345409 RepID=UPI003A8687EE